jgi:gas vesicle protein
MNHCMRYMMVGGLTLLSVFELMPQGLMMGLVAGVGAGLLLAPQSGNHTRPQLPNLAEDIGEHASCIAEEATEAANELIEQGERLT